MKLNTFESIFLKSENHYSHNTANEKLRNYEHVKICCCTNEVVLENGRRDRGTYSSVLLGDLLACPSGGTYPSILPGEPTRLSFRGDLLVCPSGGIYSSVLPDLKTTKPTWVATDSDLLPIISGIK